MKKASITLVVLASLVFVGSFLMLGCEKPDVTAPTISGLTVKLASPPNKNSKIVGKTIYGAVDVVVTATDDVGVTKVSLFVNDTTNIIDLPCKISGDTYTLFWDTQTALKDSVTYSIGAIAYDKAGNSAKTATLTYLIRIPNETPAEATILTPKDNEKIKVAAINIQWQGSDPDTLIDQQLKYDLYFGTNKANLKLAEKNIKGSSNPKDTARWSTSLFKKDFYLKPNTTYYWKVVTKDRFNKKSETKAYSFSREANEPPYSCSPYFPAEGATITLPAGDSIKLVWNGGGAQSNKSDPNDDPVEYRIYLGTDSTWNGVSVKASGITVRAGYVKGLAPGKTYYWRVVGEDHWKAVPDTTGWKFWKFSTAPR